MVMTKQAEGIRRAKRETGESSTRENDVYGKAPAVSSETEVLLGYTQSTPDKKWKAFPASGAWPTECKNHTEAVQVLIDAWSGVAPAPQADSATGTEGEQVHPGTGVVSEGIEAPADGSPVTIEGAPVVDVDPTPDGGQSPDDDETDYDRPDSDSELGIDGPGIAGEPELTADSAPATHPEVPDVPDGEPAHQESTITGSEQLGDGRVAHSTARTDAEPDDRQDPEREQRIEEGEQEGERKPAPVPFSNAERDPLYPQDGSQPRTSFPPDPFADPFGQGGVL